MNKKTSYILFLIIFFLTTYAEAQTLIISGVVPLRFEQKFDDNKICTRSNSLRGYIVLWDDGVKEEISGDVWPKWTCHEKFLPYKLEVL